MNNLQEYMATEIANEVSQITDPFLLAVYLKAIVAQRCKIGGAKEDSCKNCMFQCHRCRNLYDISEEELRIFDYSGEEDEKENM